MSAFCDVDISFLDNGSPLAGMSGTSNEVVTPIYSRDPDTSDQSRQMTETPTSSILNEYNPIDDLLSLPAGGSHIANIPREAGAPTNFQDNDSGRQQANKKRKRERSNERKQKFRNKEKELVCQLRSLYDPGRQKNMTKHELLIEAIQEIKQCRNNHYESINDEL